MDASCVAKFIDSCTHDNCSANDRRVKDIINKFSSSKNGIMNSEDFLRFYEDSSKTKSIVVMKNLKSHGFNNEFE